MNKLIFDKAERHVLSQVKSPVLLRKKLIYSSLREIQSELMSLYNGPGRPNKKVAANFELQRKFMCRICAYLAIDPHLCTCGVIICRTCCKFERKWNS